MSPDTKRSGNVLPPRVARWWKVARVPVRPLPRGACPLRPVVIRERSPGPCFQTDEGRGLLADQCSASPEVVSYAPQFVGQAVQSPAIDSNFLTEPIRLG